MIFTYKLKDACRQSRLGNNRKRIFSEEVGSEGTRKFWVASQKSFLDFYSTLSPGASFYEIIEDDTWVKGYWDGDKYKPENPQLKDKDDHVIMQIIKQIQSGLEEEGIKSELENFAILDSSTQTKLSVHIILNEVKWFKTKVRVLDFTRKHFFEDDLPKKEYSVNFNGFTCSIIDLKVYGKLQNFRLIFSKKFGKEKILGVSRLDSRLCFLNELETIESTIVQGMPIEGFNPEITVNPLSESLLNKATKKSCSEKWSKLTKTIENRFNMSVRDYTELNGNTVLVLSRNRMTCERIGRVHKSNHTYLLINIDTMVVVKKCHKCESVLDSYKI